MPYTVIWYGNENELARLSFADERSANCYVIAMLPIRIVTDDVEAVEVRTPDGTVIYSHFGPKVESGAPRH